LVLRRVDAVEALDKANFDFVYIASKPVTAARAGDEYTYKMHVRSHRPFLRYTLENGPAGLAVSPDGVVRWRVPPGTRKGDGEVTIRVGELNSKEFATQRFIIHVSE